MKLSAKNTITANLETQFSEYIKGKRKKFDLQKLQIHDDLRELAGTVLQKSVWQELRSIPYGKTITYSELAVRVGKPKAVRAVASAVALNPLCIIIPCHRVLPKASSKKNATKDGTRRNKPVDIGNYALGQDMKRILLELEGAIS